MELFNMNFNLSLCLHLMIDCAEWLTINSRADVKERRGSQLYTANFRS